MQAKAPPHDMRGDFAIASEGIASRLRYPLDSIQMECKGDIRIEEVAGGERST